MNKRSLFIYYWVPCLKKHMTRMILNVNSSANERNSVLLWMAFLLFRRSCVGSELVDWLLEHCPFVQCRSMAIGVWQLLLDMGIMLSGQYYMFWKHGNIILLSHQNKTYLLFCRILQPEWKLFSQVNICILSHFINKSDQSSFDCYFSHLLWK